MCALNVNGAASRTEAAAGQHRGQCTRLLWPVHSFIAASALVYRGQCTRLSRPVLEFRSRMKGS